MVKEFATDIFVVYIRSISTGFERPVAWIPVRCLSAGDIQSIVWTVKRKLEFFSIKNGEQPQLKVLSVTCDGLAANLLFFKLHGAGVAASPPCSAQDPLDPENFLWFIVDPPHIVKIIRNNWEKSNTDPKATKCLRFEQEILWTHMEEIFTDDVKNVWR